LQLALLYRFGQEVPKNPTRADSLLERRASLLEQACNLDDANACRFLGVAWATGEGVPQDYARADSLYERACNLGNARGCVRGIDLHDPTRGGERPDPVRAAVFMQKACDLGTGVICFKLGLLCNPGLWVPKDTARAHELFMKGCVFDSKEACDMVRR